MKLSYVVEGAKDYLKSSPRGGDTAGWIAVRTALDLIEPIKSRAGMSSRLEGLINDLRPELKGSILDVGCYGGWLYPKVRGLVGYRGIDVWPDAITAATVLFGDHFELCDYREYETQHDIVWATQLHPQEDPVMAFEKLKSLAKRMLVITFVEEVDVPPGGEIKRYKELTAGIYRW